MRAQKCIGYGRKICSLANIPRSEVNLKKEEVRFCYRLFKRCRIDKENPPISVSRIPKNSIQTKQNSRMRLNDMTFNITFDPDIFLS